MTLHSPFLDTTKTPAEQAARAKWLDGQPWTRPAASDAGPQAGSRRRPADGKQEEPERGNSETTPPARPPSQPIVLVVDRPAGRLLVIFPSTRSWQELPLDRLDPLRDPLVLGVVALGDQWVERWWKAVHKEMYRLAEEEMEDISAYPRLSLKRLGRREVGGRAVQGYRIEVGERGELVFFLDEETALPLSMKARSGATLLNFTSRPLAPAELDCSSLTAIPEGYEKLEASKGTDLLIVGLFQRLGLGLKTTPRQ